MTTEKIGATKPVLSVRHRTIRGIGLVTAIFFLFLFILSWGSGLQTSLIFFAFCSLGVLLFLLYVETTMDEDTITRRGLLGRFQIRWDEVNLIEFDSMSSVTVFRGEGKQLVIPGKLLWNGKDKKAMVALMAAQAEQRGIPMRKNEMASYAMSRGTRVK